MTELLRVDELRKYFPLRGEAFWSRRREVLRAVDGVSFVLNKGETLGLVGESGCGKSTLARLLVRIYLPTSGRIQFAGEDLLQLRGESLRRKRRHLQMIFQDPLASLDPRLTVSQTLAEPFAVHHLYSRAERRDRIRDLRELVGLDPSHLRRRPHEFSGGQRQRISIARALALSPSLVVADEPVSALDVSVQAQILNLLLDLKDRLGLTYLFISHDLSVIEHICDRVAVMYLGKIVEIGTREEIFANPQHPYTQALLAAKPRISLNKRRVDDLQAGSIRGEIPNPLHPPGGCAFHPRCPAKMDICSQRTPVLEKSGSRALACWLFSTKLEADSATTSRTIGTEEKNQGEPQ
jgi:oligopeptide transport system ATP-binding protein